MVRHEGTPAAEHTPAEWRNKILHARLIVDGELLMGSDVPPERFEEPKGFSVTLGIPGPADAERLFHALAGVCGCRCKRLFGPPASACL